MSTDGFVVVAPDSTGKRIDNGVVTRSGVEYLRQRVEVPDGVALNSGSNLIGKVEITDGAGIVNTKQLGTQLTTNDVGLVSNTIIHGLTTGGGGGFVDVKVTPSGALTVDATISSGVVTPSGGNTYVRPYQEAADLSGRFRVSQLLTLFDGKIYNAEDTLKWDTKGTGTATYANNAVTLSVTAGQYVVRQGRTFCPYFSGKPQLIESTGIGFQYQAGVIKRFGYFSSSAVAPYTANLDGWYVESDGDNSTYRLVCVRNGTETHNIPWTQWDNYTAVQNYNWSKFTVNEGNFLWLGGAGLRLFMVVNGAFTLLHTIDNHAGVQDNLIFLSPNQPVRYEVRSTTGSGSYTTICSQVATEGTGSNEQGQGVAIYTPSIACNVIGTVYALCGMRKVAAYRNHHIPVMEFGATNIQTTATPEAGLLLLMRNPTVSAPLTWTANSRIETAVATNQTITNTGRVLKVIPMAGSSVAGPAPQAALRNLGVGIDNTMTELIVGYSPLTTTQNMAGYMQALEY